MSIVRTVLKNTFSLLGAQVFSMVIRFAFLVYAARLLGPEGLGKYAVILTLITFFMVGADLGVSTLAARDVARDKEKARHYLSRSLPLVLFSSIIAYLALVLVVQILGYGQEKLLLASIGGLYIITEMTRRVLESIVRAFERMEVTAAITALYGLLSTVSGIAALRLGYGLAGVFWTIVISSAFTTGILALIVYWRFSSFSLAIDLKFYRQTLKQSLPYAMLGAVSLLYFKIDTVMLASMKGDTVVGWYSAAYKLFENLLIFPAAFGGAIFPIFSRLHVSSTGQLRATYERAAKYLFMLGLPIAAGIALLANQIVLLLYTSAYQPSILPLQILSWALLLMFINAANIRFLEAGNIQYRLLATTLIFTVANVLLNLILIPRFSLVGASISTLSSEALAFALFYRLVRQSVAKVRIFGSWLKPVAAVAVMSVAVLFLREINIFVAIAGGAAVYGSALLLMKAVSADERAEFLEALGLRAAS